MADPAPPPNQIPNEGGGVETRTARERREQQQLEAGTSDDSRDNSRGRNSRTNKTTMFAGAVVGMKGHVFQLPYEGKKRASQFTKSMVALQAYAASNCDDYLDLKPMFADTLVDATVPIPSITPPRDEKNQAHLPATFPYLAWKKQCEGYERPAATLAGNKATLWTIVWGQCSVRVQAKAEATAGYIVARDGGDLFWLLTTLKSICHGFEQSENLFMALVTAKKAVLMYRQFAGPNARQILRGSKGTSRHR